MSYGAFIFAFWRLVQREDLLTLATLTCPFIRHFDSTGDILKCLASVCVYVCVPALLQGWRCCAFRDAILQTAVVLLFQPVSSFSPDLLTTARTACTSIATYTYRYRYIYIFFSFLDHWRTLEVVACENRSRSSSACEILRPAAMFTTRSAILLLFARSAAR